jgi:hypothetical protein
VCYEKKTNDEREKSIEATSQNTDVIETLSVTSEKVLMLRDTRIFSPRSRVMLAVQKITGLA